MTVSVEIKNLKTLNVLNALESMGLIHVLPSASPDAATTVGEAPPPYAGKDKCSFQRFRGIHAGLHGGSVEEFLAGCREDKEHELAIEKRQEEECARLAKAKLSS